MKRTSKLSAIMAITLSVAACSERTVDITPATGLVKKSIHAEIVDVKTVLDGVKTTWVQKDSVSIIDSVGCFTFVAANSGATTVLEGSVTEGHNYLGGVFPYNPLNRINSGNASVILAYVFPEVYTVADGRNLPLRAMYTNGVLKFTPLAAVVKFTIPQSLDGKLKSVRVADFDNTAIFSADYINANLVSGNVAPSPSGKKSDVKYEPESGSIKAGTYYLPVIVSGVDTAGVELAHGVKFTFIDTNDQVADMSNSAKSIKLQRGHIYNFGTLNPEFKEAESTPYPYTNLTKTFSPVVNFLYGTSKTVFPNTSVSDNVITFSDYAGRSVKGASISTGVTSKTPTLGGDNSAFAYNNYFTTSTADWAVGDYYLYKVPVSEEVKGDVAFCFSLSSQKTFMTGQWTAQWSKDGENWKDVEKMYSFGHTDTYYVLADNGAAYMNGVCTAHLKISDADALKSGDCFYFKLKLSTANGTGTAGTIRMNCGSILTSFPRNNDYASDPKVVLAYGFDDVNAPFQDVTGCYTSHWMGVPDVTLSKEGWTFSNVGGRLRCARFQKGVAGYIQTPALASLTAPTDVILSFMLSPAQAPTAVETPNITVSLTGAGTLGEITYTKPYTEIVGEWTVAHALIKGADATTSIKIEKQITGGNNRCNIDEIVVFKK